MLSPKEKRKHFEEPVNFNRREIRDLGSDSLFLLRPTLGFLTESR